MKFHFRLIRDSRKTPSWTHTLSIPAIISIHLKWLLGGLTVALFGQGYTVPVMTGGAYVLLTGVWIVYIGQRELVEKKFSGNNGEPPAAHI